MRRQPRGRASSPAREVRTRLRRAFVALNRTLRRQRRRLAMLAVMLGLAGAVVVAHGAMGGDHIGDAMVMCLAVAETAVLAVGTALVVGLAVARRPRWLIPAPVLHAMTLRVFQRELADAVAGAPTPRPRRPRRPA